MPEEELYDVETDPYEIQNLAKSNAPELQAALKRLRKVLEKWMEDTHDQGRVLEPPALAARKGATKPGTKP